jgi:hypothetical protein
MRCCGSKQDLQGMAGWYYIIHSIIYVGIALVRCCNRATKRARPSTELDRAHRILKQGKSQSLSPPGARRRHRPAVAATKRAPPPRAGRASKPAPAAAGPGATAHSPGMQPGRLQAARQARGPLGPARRAAVVRAAAPAVATLEAPAAAAAPIGANVPRGETAGAVMVLDGVSVQVRGGPPAPSLAQTSRAAARGRGPLRGRQRPSPPRLAPRAPCSAPRPARSSETPPD